MRGFSEAYGILKNHLHLAPFRTQGFIRKSEEIAALEKNVAAVGFDQAQQHARQRSLAAAAFTDNRKRFAHGDGKIHDRRRP